MQNDQIILRATQLLKAARAVRSTQFLVARTLRSTQLQEATRKEMARKSRGIQLAIGSVALVLWIVLFSGGLLIETVEYRVFLAPHAFPKHATKDRELEIKPQPYEGPACFAFLVAALWFTPTNLALLALTAGLLGGCASNIHLEQMAPEDRKHLHPERLKYLAEDPWSAMIRSFVVYLCIISGLYFALDDPFKDSTPAQYLRLAGMVSVLSWLVGHDPSRITSWIGIIPGPQSKVTVQQTVTATQDVR